MQEHLEPVVGIDIGTTTVRCAIGVMKPEKQTIDLVGFGEAPNTGFRKGSVINISDTAQAVDQAIGFAERMSGLQVTSATVNINGYHIKGIDSRGTVAIAGQEVTKEDLLRVEDAATLLQLPQHYEILSVFPRSYIVDGNSNIKDPIGMNGTRLEVDAHVVTISAPALKNLEKVLETVNTHISRLSVGSLGAAQSGLSREQQENGVAAVDIGASTTNVIVVEEGDVLHVGVIPIGSTQVTNDLAIGLRTDIKVAEAVKRNYKYLSKGSKDRPKHIKVVVGSKEYIFPTKDIELVITARIEELFEAVDKELAKVHRSKKLPGGVTLSGGGALLSGIDEVAKNTLGLSARIAVPGNIEGLKEKVRRADYAAVTGLMLLDIHKDETTSYGGKWLGGHLERGAASAKSLFSRIFGTK
jgi:cell division protein FtsA